jgi:hypothetical protein
MEFGNVVFNVDIGDVVRRRSACIVIRVKYFGGYGATVMDMTAWLKSAQRQCANIDADVDFQAWPYPIEAGASLDDALNGFGNVRFDEVIASIHQYPSDDHYIVGHSSGCAIANAVVYGMADAPTANWNALHLIALDGFRPRDDVLVRPTTECWHAWCNPDQSSDMFPFSAGSVRSLNWDRGNENQPWFKSYRAYDCENEWALHFSLVNKNASDKIVKDIVDGYDDISVNLCWLQVPPIG